MFPAAKNEKAKNAWKKPKNKTNSQQCISLDITLPQIMPVQNDTKALKIRLHLFQNDTKALKVFPAAKKWLSQNKTNLQQLVCIGLKVEAYSSSL